MEGMSDPILEVVAEAIYNTHWRETSPLWRDTSTGVKDFVRKQALEAIRALGRSQSKPVSVDEDQGGRP